MPIPNITPTDALRLIEGGATLVDIRNPDEHAREHIPGAVNVPLARIEDVPPGPLVFHCRSGVRTTAHDAALAVAASGVSCHAVAGGIEAWRRDGFPTRINRRQPIEIMRQVQLVAGGLVLIGVLLGFLVAPLFFGMSAFVGAGLMMAGATGWCGMAKLLHVLPWNRHGQSA